MTFKDVLPIIRSVAPAIATALGGPLAGTAVSALSAVLLGKPDGSEAEIATAIGAGNPDLLLKLKGADLDFAVKMKSLDIDVDRINTADRDSARKREIEVKDSTPSTLAYATFGGFFGVLALIVFVEAPPAAHDALMLMLGALGAIMTGVVQYYFGSSSGSAAKTDIIKNVIKGGTQ